MTFIKFFEVPKSIIKLQETFKNVFDIEIYTN